MNKQEFEFILQEGGGLNIEFKKPLDKSIAKDMVAFANTWVEESFWGLMRWPSEAIGRLLNEENTP